MQTYTVQRCDTLYGISKQFGVTVEEIRLEKAIATELEKTTQIIKKTGIFDNVDRIYGEPGAEYVEDQQQGQGDDSMGGGPMGGGGGAGMPPDMGMDMGAEGEIDELGAPGAEGEGDIAGAEGEVPIADEGGADTSQPMESFKSNFDFSKIGQTENEVTG